MDRPLDRFIANCRQVIAHTGDAADRVTEIAPLMLALLRGGTDFLRPEHYREDPAHYARNAIYICPDGELSLFALVWLPWQWTPVHDHGSWGVVGVVEGLLEELKRKSASKWGAGKRPFAAMPNTIARIIKSHSDKTKPELRRSYYESAKAHFDKLVRQGDPYAKTLRRASTELSELLSEAN